MITVKKCTAAIPKLQRTSNMAQRVRVPVCQCDDDLCSISGLTWWEARTNSHTLPFDCHTHGVHGTHTK